MRYLSIINNIFPAFRRCLFVSLVACSFFYASSAAYSLENLTIKAGESYQLSASQAFLSVNTLSIGNNATIVVPPGMKSWSLQANQAHIGDNVKVVGSGAFPQQSDLLADPQKKLMQKMKGAVSCADPENGKKGADGEDGMSGSDISLRLRLVSFGNLSIDVSGGKGRDGSPGEDGQDADQKEGCPIEDGGDSGAGGDAGNGGDSGHVSIIYTSENDQALLQTARVHTTVVQAPGQAGSPGKPGKPGKGSAGGYVMKKTLTGNKKWVSGGNEGQLGELGSMARIGAKGRNDIQILLTGSPKAAHQYTEKTSMSREAKSLQQQLDILNKNYDDLLKRVEKLEADKL